MQNFTQPIPLSLYIHLPWCIRKCPYCDFNSHEVRSGGVPEELYINALIQDLDEQLPQIWGRRFKSIFFGGGTPSLFSPESIQRLLSEIHARIPFGQNLEITLEANPGTIDEARFQGFREAGINRLSIGLQSLQDDKLKTLGRIHDREHALRAIDIAKSVGFTNYNLDLMHGLPNQTTEDALADLRDALAFNPVHLSWYQLTIEPNTFFHHKPPILPVEETLWEIQEEGKALLAAHDLQQYEVSAYSQRTRECDHNVNYWEFGDYLGIGAGAHSKLTDMDQQIITRYSQIKNPRDYLDPTKKFTAEKRILADKDTVFEFMLNGLRLTKGVMKNLFVERTGLPISMIEGELRQAIKKKLLIENGEKLQASELGQRFLNDLVAMFM